MVLGKEDFHLYFPVFLIIFVVFLLLKILVIKIVTRTILRVNAKLADRAAYHCWKLMHSCVSLTLGIYSLIESKVDVSSVFLVRKNTLFDPTIYSPFLIFYLMFSMSDKVHDSIYLYLFREKYKFNGVPSVLAVGHILEFVLFYLVARFPHHILFVCFALILLDLGSIMPLLFFFVKSVGLEKVSTIIYTIDIPIFFLVNSIAFPFVVVFPLFQYIFSSETRSLFQKPPLVSPTIIWTILIMFFAYSVFTSLFRIAVSLFKIKDYSYMTTHPLTSDGSRAKASDKASDKEKKKVKETKAYKKKGV